MNLATPTPVDEEGPTFIFLLEFTDFPALVANEQQPVLSKIYNDTWSLAVLKLSRKNPDSVRVRLRNESRMQIKARAVISVIDDNNVLCGVEYQICRLHMKTVTVTLGTLKEVLDGLEERATKTLKIRCQIWIFGPAQDMPSTSRAVQRNRPAPELPVSLTSPELKSRERNFENGDGSDVTFLIGNGSIQAHRPLLRQACRGFASMFPLVEDRTLPHKTVCMQNVKYDVFKEFLRYLYVGKINDFDNHARDLIELAEAFGADGLWVKCQRFLFAPKTVNVVTAPRIANVANASETLRVATSASGVAQGGAAGSADAQGGVRKNRSL